MSQRNKAQHNIHASLSFGTRVVLGCLFPKNIDRFTDRCVAKFKVWNNDAVQLFADRRRAAKLSSYTDANRRARHTVFADRLLPGSFHLPKLTSSRLIVRFLAVLIFCVINFLLALPRRCVVRIEREHLIVSFHGKIVLARLIKTIGVCEQLLHFFDLVDEVRRDRFIEVTRRAQMLVEFLGFAAIGIVTAA